MKFLDGGLENIGGFSFSAIECGIRYEGRLDYCLIVSEKRLQRRRRVHHQQGLRRAGQAVPRSASRDR